MPGEAWGKLGKVNFGASACDYYPNSPGGEGPTFTADLMCPEAGKRIEREGNSLRPEIDHRGIVTLGGTEPDTEERQCMKQGIGYRGQVTTGRQASKHR